MQSMPTGSSQKRPHEHYGRTESVELILFQASQQGERKIPKFTIAANP